MKLNNITKPTFIAAFVLAAPAANAQEVGAGMREMLNDPLFWGFSIAVIFLLIALFALNKALNTVREVTVHRMAQTDAKEAEKAETASAAESSGIMQALTDATPVEQEAEIMLDHDYDGIHELDNNLPPWWIWGFYAQLVMPQST